jgi:tetratricopeptide (TPR) repeat protein
MGSTARLDQLERRVPRLAPSWDPSGQQLSAAEGFLLSRIDGQTPWTQLRQIGGIPPEEADACLERWISDGVVEFENEQASQSTASGSDEAHPPDPRLDPSLDLDPEFQQRILDFEGSLNRPYFELLDVARDADAKEIKRAYFELSKVYHPDRYFRRKLGDFADRLERIFRKLLEAYEILSDPQTRAEIERSMLAMPQPEPQVAAEAPPEAISAAPQPPPRKLTKRETLERLRGHFKIPQKLMAERRMKAAEFFKAAMVSAKRERFSEAAPSLRLAIAFDPWNDEYRAQFPEVLSRYHEQRAEKILEPGSDPIDAEAQAEALRLLEEVLIHRPADPDVNHRAALLAVDLRDLDRAVEYAEAAAELCPDSPRYQLTLARVLRRAGRRDTATQVLIDAARRNPGDRELQAELHDGPRSKEPT